MTLSPQAEDALVASARAAQQRSHSPYSRFPVGAALRDREGRHWPGCNIENASYTLGCCAERVAVFGALARESGLQFDAIAIVSNSSPGASPCGACRQILSEFAPRAVVIVEDGEGKRQRFAPGELLPHSFDSSVLIDGK